MLRVFRKKFLNYEFHRPFCNALTKNTDLNGRDISFVRNSIGNLAEGSGFCFAKKTAVHAVVTSAIAKEAIEDFLPLTVDYRNRIYGHRLIPQNTNKRERHGGDDEILVARMIDRAVRPLFPKGYINEVQLTVTSHAADGVVDPVILAVNAASFALMQSRQPWNGPIGCVRIGQVDGQLIVNPTIEEMKKSSLDLVYAGTTERSIMIETFAKEIEEDKYIEALRLAHASIQPLIQSQHQSLHDMSLAMQTDKTSTLKAKQNIAIQPEDLNDFSGITTWTRGDNHVKHYYVPSGLSNIARTYGYEKAVELYLGGIEQRDDRSKAEGKLRSDLLEYLKNTCAAYPSIVLNMAVEEVMADAFRYTTVKYLRRSDKRKVAELRPIEANHHVLAALHGSSYFQRGDTHVLSTVTLGSKFDARLRYDISNGEEVEDCFMLHYDFPPYCTGETGSVTITNRRMVGHGNLAEKSVKAVMPNAIDEFPYTVRLFAECTSSNGSSSMASVCAASLALMDAGVPIKSAVAGLSMGLMSSKDKTTGKEKFVLLTDILGSEDHYGDMDFKIAGSRNGITGVQLDVKLENGIPLNILENAIVAAKVARHNILDIMDKNISKPNKYIKSFAPKSIAIRYDAERTRHLIGHGGEMLRFIEETYDVTLTIEKDANVVYIYGTDHSNVQEAAELVRDVVVEPKENDIFEEAEVIELRDYGALMKLTRATEGLLHVSQITSNTTLKKKSVKELLMVGQRIPVKIIAIDKDTGIVKLSRSAVLDDQGLTSKPDFVDMISPEIAVKETAEENSKKFTAIPKFPTAPPKKFSELFFEKNIVPKREVEKFMTAQETIKSPDPVFQAFQKPQSTVKANDRFSGNADVQYLGKKMQVYGKERRFENEVKASTMQGDESNTTVTMQHNRSSGNVDNSFIKSKYVSTQPFVNDGKNGDGELLKIKQKGGDALNISDGTIKSQNSHMSHSKESENDVFAYTKQLKLMREQYPFLRNIHYEFSTDKDGRVKCKISYFNALDEAKMKIPRKLETAFVASGFDHDESLENAAKIAVTNILDNKVWFGVSSAVTSADNNNFVNGNATINMRLDMSKLDHNQMGDITAGTKKKDFIAGVGQAVGPFDSVPMANMFVYTKQLKSMHEQYPFLRNMHYEFSTEKDGRVKCKIYYFNALDDGKMKIPHGLERAVSDYGFDRDKSFENAAKKAVFYIHRQKNLFDTYVSLNKAWFGASSGVTSANNNNFVVGNKQNDSKTNSIGNGNITAGTKKKDFITGVGQAVGLFDSVPMANVFTKQLKSMHEQYPFLRNMHYEFSTEKDGRVKCKISYFNALDKEKMKIPHRLDGVVLDLGISDYGFDRDESLENAAKRAVNYIHRHKNLFETYVSLNNVWFGAPSAVTSADNNNFVVGNKQNDSKTNSIGNITAKFRKYRQEGNISTNLNGNANINMGQHMSTTLDTSGITSSLSSLFGSKSNLDHNKIGDITVEIDTLSDVMQAREKKDFIAGVGQAVGPFDSVPMADVMAPVTAVTAALTTSSPIKKPKKRSTSTGKKEKLENVVMATDLSSIIPPENATSSSPTLSYVSSESSKSSNSSLLESIQQSLRTLFDDPLHSEEDK